MAKQTAAPASPEPTPTPTPDPIETGAASFFAQAFDKLQTGEPIGNPDGTPPAPAPTPTPAPTPDPEPAPAPSSLLGTLDNVFGKKDAEPAPDAAADDDALPEDVAKATAKAQTSWRQLKEVLKTRTKEVEALRKEYEDFKKTAKPADDSELAALRARVEEQEGILKVSKVEATAEYREAVTEPLRQIQAGVVKMAEKHGLSTREVADAMNEEDPDRQAELLTDLAAGLPDFDRIRLYEMAKENGKVQSLRQRVLANADEAMKRIEKAHADEAAKTQEVRGKERAKALDVVWGQLQEAVPLFREQEGNEAWNTTLKGLNESIRATDIDSLDTVERVRLATRGAVAPVLLQMLAELHSNYSKVSAELAGIKKATPKVGALGTDPGSQLPKADDPNMTFADRIKLALNPGA